MKPLEYVKKYNLDQGVNFSHNEFISDLTMDFITLLEVGNARSNIKGYNNAVNAIRMKWDGIDKKTAGQLPEKLWNYFFASVIAKLREELFPEEMQRQRQEKEDWKKRKTDWERMEREQDSWIFGFFLHSLFSKQKPISSFQTLGLESDATLDDVKVSYRKLSMLHHPDKGGNRDKFIEITEAKNKCLAFLS
jgi:hypothetical protein